MCDTEPYDMEVGAGTFTATTLRWDLIASGTVLSQHYKRPAMAAGGIPTGFSTTTKPGVDEPSPPTFRNAI